MNCERFDKVIKTTFGNYGAIGVDVQLLSVKDKATPTPPGDWYTVVVEVTPVTPKPDPHADVWYYGGLISHHSEPVPIGIRPIDKGKLMGCCNAAKKLPVGFPLDKASGELYWPLYPTIDEPIYIFHYKDAVCSIGAYTGDIKSCDTK
jgi:hypothetical protein